MKSVLLSLVCAVGLAVTAEQASAQYPIYGGGFGYGSHHDQHYSTRAPMYTPSYGSTYGAYGYGNSIPPVYGNSYSQPQFAPPVSTSYYSNNYYGRPIQSHHNWHAGHYLSGHH
ncbi:hypothetical protein SH501x_001323 [Pirellulaceae bacterium SH501]